LKKDKIKIFFGHCFYNEKRVKKYRDAVLRVFKDKSKYSVQFGTKKSFQIYENFFKEIKKLIRDAKYCIFDLIGYDPQKSKLNLNVLLELGVSIGANKKYYFLSAKSGKCKKLSEEITDIRKDYMPTYKKGNIRSLTRELKDIKTKIDEYWKARHYK